MNRAAVELYGFTAEECSAEARIALLDEMLSDTAQLKKEMRAFMARLAGQGITAIKDVCFNDAPELMNAWDELEKEDALLLREALFLSPYLRLSILLSVNRPDAAFIRHGCGFMALILWSMALLPIIPAI